MILVDEPAAFPADLLGRSLGPDPDRPRPDLWGILCPTADPHACSGPDHSMPFWRSGFLVATPQRSQFDLLRHFSADHPLEGPVWCLAAAGEACRGQHGRRWQAQPGNLHLSVALSAPAGAMEPGLVLNGLAVVATLDAIGSWLPPSKRPGIKWVNDLWLEGGKVGGVLTAVRRRPDRDEVFLGIGLNVVAAPEVLSDRFTPRVTCLAAHALEMPGLAEVVPSVLSALENRWTEYLALGPGPLVAAYRDASLVTGRPGRLWPDGDVQTGRPLWQGRITGIADDLGLLVEGRDQAWHEGRLELEEP